MILPFRRASWAAALALLAGGCAVSEKPADVPPPQPTVTLEEEPEWRRIASSEDVDRIDTLGSAWIAAIDEARRKGFRKAIDEEGELLKSDAGLPRPEPTPGSYRCRVIKLGSQGKGGLAFNSYKPFFCYVEADGPLLTIVKQTGSQRPAGRLYPDGEKQRLVFLGTLALGSEEAPLPYGENKDRDMAGVMERVAPFRFRLVIPWPRHESKLDVIELTPVMP